MSGVHWAGEEEEERKSQSREVHVFQGLAGHSRLLQNAKQEHVMAQTGILKYPFSLDVVHLWGRGEEQERKQRMQFRDVFVC